MRRGRERGHHLMEAALDEDSKSPDLVLALPLTKTCFWNQREPRATPASSRKNSNIPRKTPHERDPIAWKHGPRVCWSLPHPPITIPHTPFSILFYPCWSISPTSIFNSHTVEKSILPFIRICSNHNDFLWTGVRFGNVLKRKDNVPSVHDRSVWQVGKCQKTKCLKWACLPYLLADFSNIQYTEVTHAVRYGRYTILTRPFPHFIFLITWWSKGRKTQWYTDTKWMSSGTVS